MAEWAYNPITGNLDRIGQGGGGGGNITISGDSGPPLNGDSFAFVGQEAGASNTPVMDVDTSTGDVVYANNTWWTPYVVDASVVPGLKGTYQTIQAAIDAAVLDGASLSAQKMIYIRFGTYTENLNIPAGIFLRGDAMYGQPGAVPLYATILGNHTLAPTNLFRAQGLYFVNPDSALDLFINSGAINIFNMFQCVLDNGASTGYALTSDFNYNQFVNCIFFGSAGVAGINMTGGMATFNFCSFPQGMGFDNAANLRIYDCNNVGVITNNNGSVFAYNTQFGAGGGPTCIQGTGASNLLHDCEFTCSGDAVDTPTSQACMVNCYLTPGTGASLCSAATLATTISAQAGCIYFHTDVSTNVSPTDGDLVLMVDSTSGPITVTMQASGTRDRLWVIKDVAGQAAVNNITIQVQTGKLIDGLTTYVLNQAYQAVGLSRYNGEDFVSIWDANKGGSGGGSGNVLITKYETPGSFTWTKNADAIFVEAYGWGGGSGGGGGGTSDPLSNIACAGAGASNNGGFYLNMPAANLGATAPVVVGAGGAGGAGATGIEGTGADGSPGEVSSFANISTWDETLFPAFTGGVHSYGQGGGPGSNFSGGQGQPIITISGPQLSYLFGGQAAGVADATDGYGYPNDIPSGYSGGGLLGGLAGAGGGSVSGVGQTQAPGVGGSFRNAGDGSILRAGGIAGATAGAPGGIGLNGGVTADGGIIFPGTGGGGGAADSAGNGGNGGNGGNYGGGGGGGAGAPNGFTAGTGGSGGSGAVWVIEHLKGSGGSGPGTAITEVNVRVLTADATYTPSVGMVYAVVETVGAGAAAGSSAATLSSQSAPAGGGGGGEYASGIFDSATIGASQAVTIGAGGIAVSGNNPGGNGGTTSFGSLLTALGGSGGSGAASSAGATSNNGGAGGTGGTGGDIRFPGVYGTQGYFSGSDQMGHGGAGGGSRYSGGVPENDSINSAGSNGIGYGSGGSGSYNLGVTTARAGGNGSPGVVYITEYIAGGGGGGGGGSPFTDIVVNGPTTLNGAQIVKFITTAIDYNALITDYGIGVTSTATPRSIVLPTTGATAGQTWEIKDQGGNASVNNITITAEGGALIDNAASLLINGNYQGWTIRFDGTNFWTR